jgi:hypothetical protein
MEYYVHGLNFSDLYRITKMKTAEQKLNEMIIVSTMIDRLTDNKIVLDASRDALNVTASDLLDRKIVDKKFTEMVIDNLPKVANGDDFCFDDTPETLAMEEIIRVQQIIDRATAAELDVKSVSQIMK